MKNLDIIIVILCIWVGAVFMAITAINHEAELIDKCFSIPQCSISVDLSF